MSVEVVITTETWAQEISQSIKSKVSARMNNKDVLDKRIELSTNVIFGE